MRRERLRKPRWSPRPETSGASRSTRNAGAVMPIIRAYIGKAAGVDTSGATERVQPLPTVKSVERHDFAARSEGNADEERALCARMADALAADDRADSLATRAAHVLLDDIDAELRGLARLPGDASSASAPRTVPSSAGSCSHASGCIRSFRGLTR